jgi:DNA polymerase III epsilon subunit-like protein
MSNLLHNYGNIIAAVDTETTGLIPRHNDIIQICVLPLDDDLRPRQGVTPFYAEMRPDRPENIELSGLKVNQLTLERIMTSAPSASKLANLFIKWFNELQIPPGAKIMPLAHNWPFDSQFIEDWLGKEAYESIFHPHYRDLLPIASYLNDAATWNRTSPKFSQGLKLSKICHALGIENIQAHDALGDCMATAECYRELLKSTTGEAPPLEFGQGFAPAKPAPLTTVNLFERPVPFLDAHLSLRLFFKGRSTVKEILSQLSPEPCFIVRYVGRRFDAPKEWCGYPILLEPADLEAQTEALRREYLARRKRAVKHKAQAKRRKNAT